MFIFYECSACCQESMIKPELGKCPLCGVGNMTEMTVIRKDVLEKLKLEWQIFNVSEKNNTIYKDNSEQMKFNKFIKILQEGKTNKEIKLFCILTMIHEELISIHKAFELCESYGLTKSSYWGIQERFMKLWNLYWEDKNI